MAPFYKILEKEDIKLDVLEDAQNGLRIEVARNGSELISLQRLQSGTKKWHPFLYRDGDVLPPKSGWGNHATVMGYFLHRLWKEKSTYYGQTIEGGNHGFLRHHLFKKPDVESADGCHSLIYRVNVDEIPPRAYPLAVAFELRYELSASGLRIEFSFENQEPERTAHVSFGLHPGFAVSSIESAQIILPPGEYTRYMAPGNFLNGDTETISHAGGKMPFDKKHLPDSYLIGLEGISKRMITLQDTERGTEINLDFSECPYLTLWSDHHPFICIEPCWGLPDSNPPVAFDKKVGIQSIAPGKKLVKSFGINPKIIEN
ncbi:MAG: hypothetical protein ACK5LK_06930 [Chthoniobacterales bacterium]